MKLNCSVTVNNRLMSNLNLNSTQRYKNSVLAIMKTPKENEIYLLLFTSSNKNGTRYKIKSNIEKVFSRFKNEGKTTIRFKEPPHDVLISADKIQLNNFMLFIKKVWNNQIKDVPEMSNVKIPKTNGNKLDIKEKAQYPLLQGFPSHLQVLNISNCHLKRVDNRILKLKNLTTLCLDKNDLSDIPKDLRKLPLKHLSLSHNKLGKNIQSWSFLSWPLSESLDYLNLSNNKMKFFPSSLVRFKKLTVLKLSNIGVNKIPFRLFLLPNLQDIDLSRNHLLGLPGTVTFRHRMFDSLNVSDNDNILKPAYVNCSESQSKEAYIPSLLELSVRSVINNRLWYCENSVPLKLVLLLDEAKLCLCGKICSRDFGTILTEGFSKSLANTFISSFPSSTICLVYQACCPHHIQLKK